MLTYNACCTNRLNSPCVSSYPRATTLLNCQQVWISQKQIDSPILNTPTSKLLPPGAGNQLIRIIPRTPDITVLDIRLLGLRIADQVIDLVRDGFIRKLLQFWLDF